MDRERERWDSYGKEETGGEGERKQKRERETEIDR